MAPAEDCTWCQQLPPRLQQLHSHWLSRKHDVILFRGHSFRCRLVHYIFSLDTSAENGFSSTRAGGALFEVPTRAAHLALEVCSYATCQRSRMHNSVAVWTMAAT